ncbi:hypothetical protein [Roseobacter litoralis]|uniref:hypothetical protein n=1 Tax=Roseobacter litoralis TaxID=42443 RepID=UPI000160C1E3|nr:hypothetical protein [Roseobacter litoralis]
MRDFLIASLKKIASRRRGAGVGAVGATWALSNFFGISLVAHTSGGVLLTGGSGYIAGTFISATFVALFWWILVPIAAVIGIGFYFRRHVIGGFDWIVNWLYHWRNKQ